MVATLTSSFAVCLFPPFYPRLAEEKGCSAAIYGFVIGTNCLASFLVTPVIGKNVSLLQFPEPANTFLVSSLNRLIIFYIYSQSSNNTRFTQYIGVFFSDNDKIVWDKSAYSEPALYIEIKKLWGFKRIFSSRMKYCRASFAGIKSILVVNKTWYKSIPLFCTNI